MTYIIPIRVDGNSGIGFNRLTIMKALARELCKLGAEVIFLSRMHSDVDSFIIISY